MALRTNKTLRFLLFALCFGLLGLGIVLSRAFPGLPSQNNVVTETGEHVSNTSPQIIEEPPAPATPLIPLEPSVEIPVTPSDESVVLFPDDRNDALRSKLQQFSEAGHQPLSYRRAREVMYWIADNQDGVVTTIYAQRPTDLPPGQWPDPQVINCEHLWPQSKGAKRVPMKTDLFHLRPAVPSINSTRSNHPFGEPIGEGKQTLWKRGPDAQGDVVFEPPADSKGDISRSMFYFSIRYDTPIDNREEAVLRRWHAGDPVDQRERGRAAVIEEYQGNSNPFIIDPDAVQRIDDF